MRTKRLLISLLALAVAGCSTYGQTQARAPMIELQTDVGADEYMGCVAPTFAEMWIVSIIPDGQARVLTATANGPAQILATVTVVPRGTGASVAYRQIHNGSWNGYGRMQQVVRDCAAGRSAGS